MPKTANRKKHISLIPFVCGAGAKKGGTERGPAEVKKRGLHNDLRAAAWQSDPEALYLREQEFYKNLPPLGSEARRAAVLKHCREIAQGVEQAVKAGALPVTIGGDHSMAAGSIAGFAKAHDAFGRIGVIWIDAHADIHTMETSPSKTYHGMPLAALLGLGDKEFANIGGASPVLRPEHIVYIGLRSTEAAENRRISDLGIHTFDMKDISGADMKKIFAKALKAISKDIDYLVLSIDLDAFDPAEAPAVGSPEQGGLSVKDVLAALDHLTNLRVPDMVEVVEFNPDLAGAEQTYQLLKDVLATILNVREPVIKPL
ncbi:MAG: arginase [Micavibrio sp.]|nr:arginase [Micavibrio sp.]MBK9562833.1 arginase [Micavibrio sp.]